MSKAELESKANVTNYGVLSYNVTVSHLQFIFLRVITMFAPQEATAGLIHVHVHSWINAEQG